MSFQIDNNIKCGLMLGNGDNLISIDIYKQILNISAENLFHQNNTTDFSSINNSKQDVLKEFYASVLVFLTETTRHDLQPDFVYQYCIESLKYNETRAEAMKNLYKIKKNDISNQLKYISTSLPHVVDVSWKLDLIIKTSETDETGGPIFQICLCTQTNNYKHDPNDLKYIRFKCSVLELTDFISKLKDIVRHCDKIASSTN